MQKEVDAGDAVLIFPAVQIFWVYTQFFAKCCAFLHNFVVFLQFLHVFAHFLHAFLVLIFQTQSSFVLFFKLLANLGRGLVTMVGNVVKLKRSQHGNLLVSVTGKGMVQNV